MDEQFLKKYSRYLFEKYPPKLDNREVEVVLRLVKLQEEVGELAEAILDSLGQQRDKGKLTSVREELADVLITTILLAYFLDLDPFEALNEKIEKLKERIKVNS